MTKISNQVIWITGASSGIGEALTYSLAKNNNKLILSARRSNELERVKGNCDKTARNNIHILPLDLSQPSSLQHAATDAIAAFGHVDILINNGGVSQRSLAKDTLMDVERSIMETNYFGAIALSKSLLPHFLARRSGHFVTITSVTGKFGSPWRSGYAASKHALHGFFDSLRAEVWRDNIHVTLICPGFVNTTLVLHALTADGSHLNKNDRTNYAGISPEKCANGIIKAIEKKKEEVYIGGREVMGIYIKRFFPGWFSKIIRKVKVQ